MELLREVCWPRSPQDRGWNLALRWLAFFGLCLALSTGPPIYAAGDHKPQYIRTDFTVDDGLPNNTVNSIIETKNGLLWLGTDSGLASFDGRTFTPVRLRIPGKPWPGTVNSLALGSDGDLWVGTDTAVIRIPSPDLNDPDVPHSAVFLLGQQQSDEIEVVYKDRAGAIWAGTNHGLYRFSGDHFICVQPSLYVGRISQGVNGNLLLNVGNGFVEFDGTHLIQHRGLGETFKVPDDQIFDSYQSSDGTMWICTGVGLRSISPGTGKIRSYGPVGAPAFRITAAADGALWATGQFATYEISSERTWIPVPNLEARYFFAGEDGDLWIAGLHGGLVQLRPRTAQVFTKADGLQSDAQMALLTAHDGRLWIGGNCGLAVLNGSHFKTFWEKDGLTNTCVWALAEDRNHAIWIGTWGGGLYRYHNGEFTQFTKEQGLASRVVSGIVVAKDDSLWVATREGVSHLKAGVIRNYGSADGLQDVLIEGIHQDHEGTIWVTTPAGVERLVSDRFEPVLVSPDANETPPRHFVELANGGLYTTDLPQGISQVGDGRISLLNSSLSAMDMVEGPNHTLWFSSRNGVIRISQQQFELLGKASSPIDYELFNRADGLNTSEASPATPNIAMTSDGKLWVATAKGLAMIDTRLLPVGGRRPSLFISGVMVDSMRHTVGSALDLRPGIHHIELNLAAINLSNPQKIRLQYSLEGVDTDWLDGTSSRIAVYSNIPAGKHRLFVRATDSSGKWNDPEVIYELTEEPHFYARPLFQFFCAIFGIFLLAIVYVLRMRYVVGQTQIMIEQRQEERETVARDLHDTFLQGIQGLILRFHTGTQQLAADHPLRSSFEDALKLSDGVMLEGRKVLSRLRANEVTEATLSGRFAAIGEEFRPLCQAQFEVVESGKRRDLNAALQDDIVKIGKEALFNACRHSKAEKIETEIHFGFLEFRLRIRDDGVGIDPTIVDEGNIPGHYGLPGMRERAGRIGGHLELWSRAGMGTEIQVRIPSALAYGNSRRGMSLLGIFPLFSRSTIPASDRQDADGVLHPKSRSRNGRSVR